MQHGMGYVGIFLLEVDNLLTTWLRFAGDHGQTLEAHHVKQSIRVFQVPFWQV
jgi:hypothetical protein